MQITFYDRLLLTTLDAPNWNVRVAMRPWRLIRESKGVGNISEM